MKKIINKPTVIITLLLLLQVSFSNIKAQEKIGINWKSIDQIQAAQAVNPKPVFVNLYTDWCVWCTKMDESTYSDPKIINYINNHFYALTFDAEGDNEVSLNGKTYNLETVNNRKVHTLAWDWGSVNNRIGYPTIVVLDNNMEKIQAFPGFKDSEAMNALIKYYGEGIYKTKSWQDYLTNGN
ncbi:MAG: DUF255 domain-containing protein [Chitinophagales bacterium]|nr:DUF255 domain-containing protein [Chitinophagales bacterium]